MNQRNCAKDIARQLIEDEPGNQFKVICYYMCIHINQNIIPKLQINRLIDKKKTD